MRVAKPHELKSRAVPVMTASMSEDELSNWFPVRFQDIVDPLATLEPSKGALVQLDAGPYVVLYYGRDSKCLTVRIAEGMNASKFLADFFREVPRIASRVLWHRPDVMLPRIPSRARPKTSTARQREVVVRASTRQAVARSSSSAAPKRNAPQRGVAQRRGSSRKK